MKHEPKPFALFLPAAAAPPLPAQQAAGLIIPDRAWTAEALGLTAVPPREPLSRDLVGVFLTANEYLRPVLEARGEVFDRDALINSLLQLHSAEAYLCMLAALNHYSNDADQVDQCLRQVLSSLAPDVAERIEVTLAPTAGDASRSFLARHVVLRTMHVVLVPPEAEPDPERISAASGLLGNMSLETASVVLTHLVGDGVVSVRREGEPLLAGQPESLAMELIANNLFYDRGDPGALLARARLFWNNYGARLHRVELRRRPIELLEEAAGVDFDDMTALAFAYYSQILDHSPDKPIRFHAFTNLAIDEDKIEAFLSRFASTPEELAAALRGCPQRWQLLALQDRPLLRLDDEVVVLDERYLLERVTLGLYWLVHDHEKTQHGDKARLQWTQAYAEMIESRVEDQLRMVAPPLILSEDRTFFTEEDLQKAFSVKGKTASAVDAGIDFGDAVVLVEVVSASVSVHTREHADAAAFRKDVDKIVLKKARQLDTTAMNLLKDPQPDDSPLRAPAYKIFPVAVRGGQFAVSSLISRYIKERVDEEGLFADARVRPLALLDLDELDACVALSQSHDLPLPQVLQEWQESDLGSESLRTYLALRGPTELVHAEDVSAALEATFAAIGERLGFDLAEDSPARLGTSRHRQE